MIKKLSCIFFVFKFITAFLAVFSLSFSWAYAFDCDDLISVDVNSASKEELECLDGIGPAYAQKILEMRPFSSLEDLDRVSGISSGRIENLKEQELATIDGGVVVEEEKEEKDESEDKEEETEETEKTKTKTETSAHSSPVSLSKLDKVKTFKVSAGRDRLVSVENGVNFRVYTEKGKELPRNTDFEWVMGDGSVKRGREVDHKYFAPGSYSVVLTVRIGKEEAVSRVNVKVIEPEISIKNVDNGSVTLFNHSEKEINLGDWEIISKKESFLIPNNTIIKPDKELSLPKQVTGIEVVKKEGVKIISPEGGFESVYKKEGEIKEEGINNKDQISQKNENKKLILEIDFLREEIDRLVTLNQNNENKRHEEVDGPRNMSEEGEVEQEEGDLYETETELKENKESNLKLEENDTGKTKDGLNNEDNRDDLRVIYEKDEKNKGLWRSILGSPSFIFDKLPF